MKLIIYFVLSQDKTKLLVRNHLGICFQELSSDGCYRNPTRLLSHLQLKRWLDWFLNFVHTRKETCQGIKTCILFIFIIVWGVSVFCLSWVYQ